LDTLTFPADVPLTVDHGVIMWSVQVHDQRYRVPTRLTQSTFADTCDLNADRSIALCKAYQDMDQVDALLVQMTNPHTYAAVRAAFFDLFANRNPFVLIRKDTSAVVPLTREMDPRTNCRWYDARQVACTTSHGTGVWTVMLFDTIQMDYTPLPTAGNIEWSYAFRRGYVHVQDAPPELQQFTIYGFDSTIMTQFRTFYLATTADTLLYITPCDAGKLCVQGLVIGTAGIERSHRWDLGLTEQETRRCAWEIRLQGDQAIIHACNQQVVIALSEL
jgi:hypothetical protein